MKKKMYALLLALAMLAALAGCGESAEPVGPADLTGEWKQTNSNSEDSWQSATISGDTIEVYWVTESGNTKALYWAGTFTAPTTGDEPYTWDSENDTEKTGSALLASSAETKQFTYENGKITYEVTAMGATTTVELERE